MPRKITKRKPQPDWLTALPIGLTYSQLGNVISDSVPTQWDDYQPAWTPGYVESMVVRRMVAERRSTGYRCEFAMEAFEPADRHDGGTAFSVSLTCGDSYGYAIWSWQTLAVHGPEEIAQMATEAERVFQAVAKTIGVTVSNAYLACWQTLDVRQKIEIVTP